MSAASLMVQIAKVTEIITLLRRTHFEDRNDKHSTQSSVIVELEPKLMPGNWIQSYSPTSYSRFANQSNSQFKATKAHYLVNDFTISVRFFQWYKIVFLNSKHYISLRCSIFSQKRSIIAQNPSR